MHAPSLSRPPAQFIVPTRGMIGIRSALLTATKGTLVLDTVFDSYRPVVGAITQREKGSLLAFEEGTCNPFGIAGAQDRGRMFIQTKDDVYKVSGAGESTHSLRHRHWLWHSHRLHFIHIPPLSSCIHPMLHMLLTSTPCSMPLPPSTQDMIIGVHQRPGDLAVNVCKTKALTNMRAAGSDDTIKVPAPPSLSRPLAFLPMFVSSISSLTLTHSITHSLTPCPAPCFPARSSRPWS